MPITALIVSEETQRQLYRLAAREHRSIHAVVTRLIQRASLLDCTVGALEHASAEGAEWPVDADAERR